ncbi:hypothetical protein BDL97_04G139000 [Sphagnum fallax]|nr:hypothetical protein BDL97_04G139000 [Sphagnum fallax]
MAKNGTTAIVRQQVGPRQVDFKMPMRGGGGVQAGDWVENLLAGGTASTLSKIILQPFDTSKTLLQAVGELRGRYAGNLGQCMVRLVKERGLGGLYTGFLASIAVSAPSSAVFAVGYEFSKNALESTPLHQFAPVLAAALGNVTASIVRVPPEVIKQRVQAAVYKNVFEATSQLWAKEGIQGFYCGYSSMLARDIPYSAVQFTVFEMLKKLRSQRLQKEGGQQAVKSGKHMANDLWMGAVAGAVASSLTNPLDVVKTRVMTQTRGGNVVHGGLRSIAKQIWMEEVPASAVFLVCYEAMKRILRSARRARQQLKALPEESAKSRVHNEALASDPLPLTTPVHTNSAYL